MENEWAYIPDLQTPYRISKNGVVQQFRFGKWVTLKQEFTPRRTEVRMRTKDGKQKRFGVFRLLDKFFCDGYGEKNGLCVGPKNGVKSECTLENLAYKTQSEIAKNSLTMSMQKPVVRYDKNGNTTVYKSVKEAAKKSGMTPQSLDRRIYGGVLDPRGYRWEIFDG